MTAVVAPDIAKNARAIMSPPHCPGANTTGPYNARDVAKRRAARTVGVASPLQRHRGNQRAAASP
jgi:hypothetical protein